MPAASLSLSRLRVDLHGRRLLHDLDLEVPAGERVALLGRSGSGKSLTAAAITGTLPAYAVVGGRVEIGGGGAAALVGQDSLFALHPQVGVGVQIARPLRSRGIDPDVGVRQALLDVDLSPDLAGRLPAELSGGQRQRVCIALARAVDAPVLVADEPTTALDLLTQRRVLDALDRERSTLLLITHDVAVAAELCSRAVVLEAGRLVDDLPMTDLLAGRGAAPARALTEGLHGALT
ncbi:ABC transporter ATP-binding protein [Alteromonas gracilis]